MANERFVVKELAGSMHADKLKELGFKWCTKDGRFETPQLSCSKKKAAIKRYSAEQNLVLLDGEEKPVTPEEKPASFF